MDGESENEEVLQRMNEKRKLINIMKDKKLKNFGHLIRLIYIYRTLLEGYIDGKRGRGRPRMSWCDHINEWTGMRHERATGTETHGELLCHPTSKDLEHKEEELLYIPLISTDCFQG